MRAARNLEHVGERGILGEAPLAARWLKPIGAHNHCLLLFLLGTFWDPETYYAAEWETHPKSFGLLGRLRSVLQDEEVE